jgi:hypothetical protein
VRAKTPLAEVFFFLPDNGTRKILDSCGGVIFSPFSWEPQEEGMMNIAARFSFSKKPRFIDLKENKPND